MAESVDALVSNTSGAIRPGSTPGLGTKESILREKHEDAFFFYTLKDRREPGRRRSGVRLHRPRTPGERDTAPCRPGKDCEGETL